MINPPFLFASPHPAGRQSLGSADPTRAAESGNQRLRLAPGLGPASQCHGELLLTMGTHGGLRMVEAKVAAIFYRMVTLAIFL